MKSGKLKFLEPCGPLQACNGTALPLLLCLHNQLHVLAYVSHHQVIAECCVPSISWLIFLQHYHSKVISDSNFNVFLKVVNIG